MQRHKFETRKNLSFNGTVQNQAQGHKCLELGQRGNVRTLTNCDWELQIIAKCFTRIQSKVNSSKCDKSICLLGFTPSVASWSLCINERKRTIASALYKLKTTTKFLGRWKFIRNQTLEVKTIDYANWSLQRMCWGHSGFKRGTELNNNSFYNLKSGQQMWV